jgi:hypothetical protein
LDANAPGGEAAFFPAAVAHRFASIPKKTSGPEWFPGAFRRGKTETHPMHGSSWYGIGGGGTNQDQWLEARHLSGLAAPSQIIHVLIQMPS